MAGMIRTSAIPNIGSTQTVLKKLGRVDNPMLLTELRTGGAEGVSNGLPPEVGKTFDMIAKSPNPEADARWVSTSEIKKVEKLTETKYRFETLNSIYEVEFGSWTE